MRLWMRGGMKRQGKRGGNDSESTGKIGQEIPANQPTPLQPMYPESERALAGQHKVEDEAPPSAGSHENHEDSPAASASMHEEEPGTAAEATPAVPQTAAVEGKLVVETQ